MRLVDDVRNYEIQYSVTQELETLIIFTLHAAVSQRLSQQLDIIKMIIKRLLKPGLGFVQFDRSSIYYLFTLT